MITAVAVAVILGAVATGAGVVYRDLAAVVLFTGLAAIAVFTIMAGSGGFAPPAPLGAP